MSDYVIALIAGIVEGLTEFLPVSSTAHIIITQKLLGIELSSPFWKMFTVVIQLGAILSVVVFFRKRIVGFLQSFWAAFRGLDPVNEKDATTDLTPLPRPSKHWLTHPLSLVLISFVVTAIPCFLMDKWIGENLESPTVIGIALIVGGIVMVLIDLLFSKGAQTGRMEDMTLSQAIAIGSAQILAATFPGTSRSMATIAGGQVMGLTRTTALEFSFFLSIPVMFAASGFKLIQFLVKEPIALSSSQWLTLAIGFTTSFLVALIVIAWFMGWVRKHGFIPFAIYRVIVGMAVLAWLR
jgi:undecaprenyl-diphosphatase